MKTIPRFLVLLIPFHFFAIVAVWARKICRCLPTDPCWPSSTAWQQFNDSISGRLIQVEPPAKPCHDPGYDAGACQEVQQNWSNGYWRSDQPGAMQLVNWEVLANETWQCQLNVSRSTLCTQGNIPVYSVNVSSIADVQTSVRFAAQHNLRVTIKSSGHDLLGRSSASGALEIWNHYLNQITLHDNFVPANSTSTPTKAVTVQSGLQLVHMYEAIADRNWVVVGGAALTLAAGGGYVQGGGHSPLSPVHGLAADNALQFTVVLADGQVVVANEAQHTDIFWALRGGGGGTYGVVIDATLKAFDGPSVVSLASFVTNAHNSSAMSLIMEDFIRLQPRLSLDGWSGLAYLSGTLFALTFYGFGIDASSARTSLAEFVDFTHSLGTVQTYNVTQFGSWYEWWKTQSCPAGVCVSDSSGSVYLASRLIPISAFRHPKSLATALLQAGNKSDSMLLSLVAGGQVSKRDADFNAVNPAWRRALWHVVLANGFQDTATVADRTAVHNALTDANQILRDIAPHSGCYFNEADINEPNWQQAFFGSHYARLKHIKNSLDPNHLFVCPKCVGSDDWDDTLTCRLK